MIEEDYSKKCRKGIMIMVLISILFLIMFFVVVSPVNAAQTLNSSVNLTERTTHSLTWEVKYKAAIRPTGATFDGIEIEGFDLIHELNYTVSDLEPNTTHQFCIYKDLYNCEKGTTLPDYTENNYVFVVFTLLGIICIIVAMIYNRIIGFIGLLMGGVITMLSFNMDAVALVTGIIIALASIIAVFNGKGD